MLRLLGPRGWATPGYAHYLGNMMLLLVVAPSGGEVRQQAAAGLRGPDRLISGLVNDITQASLVVQMAFNTIVSLYSFFRCCWEMYRFDGTLSLYMLLLLPIAVLVFALVGHLQ